MLVVFLPIFLADTKIIFVFYFAASLTNLHESNMKNSNMIEKNKTE